VLVCCNTCKEKKEEKDERSCLRLLTFTENWECGDYASIISSKIGMCKNQELCWHLEVINKALTTRKSADCTIPLKKFEIFQ